MDFDFSFNNGKVTFTFPEKYTEQFLDLIEEISNKEEYENSKIEMVNVRLENVLFEHRLNIIHEVAQYARIEGIDHEKYNLHKAKKLIDGGIAEIPVLIYEKYQSLVPRYEFEVVKEGE